MPHREKYLFVCTNRREDGNPKGSCAQKGAEEIVTALKAELKKRGLGATVARACASGCLDLCEIGAAIVVEPQHIAYGGVKLSDVEDIVDAIEKNDVVDHLVRARGDA